MAINDLYTIHFRFEGAGAGFTTKMDYQQTGGTNDQNTLTDLCTNVSVLVEDAFKDCLSNQISFNAMEAFQVVGANETPGLLRFETPNSGTVVSESLPMGGAAVLSILTDAPNSKHNGRMFVGGIPESFEANGALTAPAIALYQTLADGLSASPAPVGPGLALFTPGVISRIVDGVPRVPPIMFDVDTITPDGFVKNQRRRNTRFLGFGPSTP